MNHQFRQAVLWPVFDSQPAVTFLTAKHNSPLPDTKVTGY